jgi:hypothetical protein
MKKYLGVLLLAFFYGGLEVQVLDKMEWWKTGWMVPYWITLTTVLIALSYLCERRATRALLWGSYSAFVVLDAGYWFLGAFPRYPFPVYNWWQGWWPWNSFPAGYLFGEPLPVLGIPAYYLLFTLLFIILWVLPKEEGTQRLAPGG